jgi:hypothetical protein
MSLPQSWHGDMSRRAVARLKELVQSGGFQRATAIDPLTGELVSTESRALFAALPSITGATHPSELLDLGLLAKLPRGLAEVVQEPKYIFGRELFVQAHVNHRVRDPQRPVGEYRADADLGFTHRARSLGEDDDRFVLELEGAPALLRVAKTDIFAWNEPRGVPSSGGVLANVHIDYNEPLMKAQICAAFIDHAHDIELADFPGHPDDVKAQQERVISRLAARQHMRYAGTEGYNGNMAGVLFTNGQGVCFVQRAVAAGFLQAFTRALAFEVMVCAGRTLKTDTPHGFVVVTLRPSMARYVSDPAWHEPLTDIRVAFFGPGWGHDRKLVGFEGLQDSDAPGIRLPELTA